MHTISNNLILFEYKTVAVGGHISYNADMLKSTASTDEKRVYYRHPIRVPLELHLTNQNNIASSRSDDISLGGLSFLWRDRLAKGYFLDINIPVKEKLFLVKAKVVYSKEDRKTGKFKTGVLFCDLPSAFRAKLAEEALEILEYRRQRTEALGHEVSEEVAAEEWVQKFAATFTDRPFNPNSAD